MANGEELWKGGELLGSLLEDVPYEIIIDKYGVGSTTMHYQCFFHKAVSLISAMRRHPSYRWLVLKQATISREEASLARVKLDYEGVEEGEFNFDDDEEVQAEYSLEGQEATEPIEAHPKFVDVLAGDYADDSTWKNGAMFMQDGPDAGRFLGFMAKEIVDGPDAPSNKAGVRSYIDGGFIYSETKVYSSAKADLVRIDMNRLFKIDNPPKSKILPRVAAKRNWLLVGCAVTQVGDGMRVTKRWRLSGAKGWDKDIYDYAE